MCLSVRGTNWSPDQPGRLCQELGPGVTCCLPCPITDWVYPDYFQTGSDVASWVSVVGAICCVFLLISYAALPTEKTGRHYLSISIVSAVFLMHVSFPPSLSPPSPGLILMRSAARLHHPAGGTAGPVRE